MLARCPHYTETSAEEFGVGVSISPNPQFVVKTSKYCNLRCGYCYEFPYLGDRARMDIGRVTAMFQNIRSSVDELSIATADFIWHGGEPLLIPADFYDEVMQVQNAVFQGALAFQNSIQTNLTVLTDRHLALLRGDFFTDVGVSFDAYGDQRVDKSGRSRDDAVIDNMQKLADAQVSFGAIAVLARNTLTNVKNIYRFYDGLGIRHRFLAYYRRTGVEQQQEHGVGFDELIDAYTDIFLEWLSSDTATGVDPIEDFVRYATRFVAGDAPSFYDPKIDERVFMIDVNGDVFNSFEAYQPEFRFGNLVEQPLAEVLASVPRRASHGLAEARLRRFCHDCPYFGACPGVFVANASDVERGLLETRGCPVQAVVARIVDVFERTSIKQTLLARESSPASPALTVA
jgi:uncharacterized protein